MKTKKILAVVAMVALVACVGACKKVRYCHCVATEGDPDTIVINVDRSMKCSHIKEYGYQRLINGQWETTVNKVKCVELDDDTVATIPTWTGEE